MALVIDHVLTVYGSDPQVVEEREALIALRSEISNTKA